eukprot:NODE_1982_length_1316_cov_94.193440_g1885_i0.p1 GENE.NODE_1982_length_1316_cov_94.193440_g1885_i0~~NODE_1982_length_1316_cov_94.193440_g1885_i0.p1  ORF type:complete len:374 (+),score=132.74 NODE_1982_length_1316_cov_94.193440_g1885_i0:56-1177(+)
MASGMLTVDPERQSDMFYRYKMPRVCVKVEGNGNGIKTVVPNILDLAGILSRNVEYVMKYFAHDLAVQSKFKDDKWILTGSFSQEIIQACLFDFIRKFVLCKACRNPETVINVDEQKGLWLNCKACSRVTPIDPLEKICNLILKNEKPMAVDTKKGKGKKKQESKDEKQHKDFDANTRQATKDDKIAIVDLPKEELPPPVDHLKEFLFTTPPPSDLEVAGKVFDMKGDYGLNDKHVVSLVFESLFSEQTILTELPLRAPLMKRFLKSETEKDFITNLIGLCAESETLQPKFPILLKKAYDSEIISEPTIHTWYEGKPLKGIDKQAQQSMKAKAQPFIEWLKDDEGDEEEEEEEDQSGGEEPPNEEEELDIDGI